MAGGPGLLSGGRERELGRPYRGGDRPRRRGMDRRLRGAEPFHREPPEP